MMPTTFIAIFAAMLAAEPTKTPTAGAPPMTAHYTTVELLKSLDCVEDWAQLCSMPVGTNGLFGPMVEMQEGEVVVTPWDGPTSFKFKVMLREAGELRLELARCEDVAGCVGKGQSATLRIGPGDRAVYEGPNVYALAEGKVERVRIDLVETRTYGRRLAELTTALVPGGKCQGLMVFERTGNGACINAIGANGSTSSANAAGASRTGVAEPPALPKDCAGLDARARNEGGLVRSSQSGRIVIGSQPAQIYSAPDEACYRPGAAFAVGDLVDAYRVVGEFTFVAKWTGAGMDGWVRTSRLKATGTGIGPN